MAEITAASVKELRERTGAGMMDCKKALAENDGDMEASVDWLRAKGLAAAAKKAGRTAAEGLVGVAVAGTKGAVVEVNSETDFVAKNEQFQDFVRNVSTLALEANGDIEALKGAAYPTGGTVEAMPTEPPSVAFMPYLPALEHSVRSRSEAPRRWKKRRSIELYCTMPIVPA